MEEETTDLIAFSLQNWSFIAAMLAFASIGIAMKRLIPAHLKGWRRWFRATMPMHPVVAGALVGLIPGVPVGVPLDTIAGRCFYFMLAGVFSTWAYSVVKQLLAKKGIVLESTPPPPGSGGDDTPTKR